MLVLKEKFKVTSTVTAEIRRDWVEAEATFSEARHRLAPIEGQKEDKWKQAFPLTKWR